MNLGQVAQGFYDAGLPRDVVDELLAAYTEAKRRFHLQDLRPNEIEGGRFAEAAFRLLQHATKGTHTPLGKTLPRIDILVSQLEQIPSSTADDGIRIHIPRTLRLIYDIRNKRGVAHLHGGINPNLQDATLVVGNMDWVVAELVRIYHSVSSDDAQAIVDDLVTKAVPAIQEIAGRPVILRDLEPRQQALLMLYRAGVDQGLALDELADQLRVKRKDHLRTRLRKLDEGRLVFEQPDTGRFHITNLGAREVEENGWAEPA